MNDADLVKFITEKRDALQKMRFGVSGSGMRNTRQSEISEERLQAHSQNSISEQRSEHNK
jgi:hypothetical protein